MKRRVWIRTQKTLWDFCLSISIFPLKCRQCAVSFFDIIDFLLRLCSPKILIGIYFIIKKVFSPFRYTIIFPKSPNIRSRIYGGKISKYRIPDSEIDKIYLLRLLELISKIPRKRRESKNDNGAFAWKFCESRLLIYPAHRN